MSSPLAIRGTYADWRLVKTRGVVQIVIEVPLAEADQAYGVMGGMPQPASEKWFAIAAIREAAAPVSSDAKPDPVHQPRPDRAKRDWRDMQPSQQAGIRCEDAAFARFLKEERPGEWREAPQAADCVRLICGVESRSHLDKHHHAARVIWHQLNDEFEAWMKVGA